MRTYIKTACEKAQRGMIHLSVSCLMGAMAAGPAFAGGGGGGNNCGNAGNSYSAIACNIVSSVSTLPGLLSGLAYLIGILLGVLGVLKIKEHVEAPQQNHLKDGAIRLLAGGALFALPFVYNAMKNAIGDGNIDGLSMGLPTVMSVSQ